MLDRDVVYRLICSLLGRPPVSEESLAFWCGHSSYADIARAIAQTPEFVEKAVSAAEQPNESAGMSALEFSRPGDLSPPGRSYSHQIILIGSCFVEPWPRILRNLHPGCSVEFLLTNNLSVIPSRSAQELKDVSFQVVNVPLRTIVPDSILLSLNESDAGEQHLANVKNRLAMFIDSALRYNTEHGLQSFVTNIIVPQFNTFGRLMPRYGSSSVRHLVEEANKHLAVLLAARKNCYLVDIDAVAASLGKRFILDDSIALSNHGSFLADHAFERDENRIQVPVRPTVQYGARIREFIETVWGEILACHDTVLQQDSVKLVVTDLDDTLWRGIIGEANLDQTAIEGWPVGYMEALSVLKSRGVILAIISKNTESFVRERWADVTGNRIKLSDFASVHINWKTKVESMRDILADVNLLPKNVVYVDDNPVERAAMTETFPGMRVLGSNPYTLKRTLLLSSETQIATLTAESAKRTEMIQAQTKRNESMRSLSREEFLASLQLTLDINIIESEDHPRFARSFELLNKTNQFNTNGKRWTNAEMSRFFAGNGVLGVFEVSDIYTQYGLVGVLLLGGDEIVQFVMSCRVIGLEIETTAARAVSAFLAKRGASVVKATVVETPANTVCRDVFARAGFTPSGEQWILAQPDRFEVPDFITLRLNALSAPVQAKQPAPAA